MIEPTVGRKVWYQPTRTEQGVKKGEQPFDATIVFVHSARKINIAVRDHNGYAYGLQNVTLLQDDDAPNPEGGHCVWMPYQKGQAKRHDESTPVQPTKE